MNSLSVDETGGLVLKYQFSRDYETDYDINEFLTDGVGFTEKTKSDSEIIYVFPKTTDKVKLSKTAKFVIDFFEKKLGKESLEIGK